MRKRREIPGQHDIFEFLASQAPSVREDTVQMEGIINTKTMKDFTVQTTYKDIFLIINMLDDYIFLINQQEERDFYTDYMLNQFERISESLSEQIMLDKEKMYKKCRKAEKADTVGEDAFVLAVGKEKNSLMESEKRIMELPEFIENINILRLFCCRFDFLKETCDMAITAVKQQQEIKNRAVLQLPCRIGKYVLYLDQDTPAMQKYYSEEQAGRELNKIIKESEKKK